MNRNDDPTKRALLGNNSYDAVVFKIGEIVKNTPEPFTIAGKRLVSNMYKALNESETPILTLKPFISEGQKFASQDATISDLLEKIDTNIKNNVDLNFLINVCKEEHFRNMSRSGHPDPKKTVEHIKSEFDKVSNDVEKKIAEGIFDDLQSTLLGTLKKELGFSENEPTENSDTKQPQVVKATVAQDVAQQTPVQQKTQQQKQVGEIDSTEELNESQIYNSQYVKFAPVGFIAPISGANYCFVENQICKVDTHPVDNSLELNPVDTPPNISGEFERMAEALSSLSYDPETEVFTTEANWDFKISLNNDGTLTVMGSDGVERPIDPDQVSGLFIESMNLYASDPEKYPDYDEETYTRDADNFNILANNWDMLIKLDNLRVVKDMYKLNESVMFDTKYLDRHLTYGKPRLMYWSNPAPAPIFESYRDMANTCNNFFGTSNLFESILETPLKAEQEMINKIHENIAVANEKQHALNSELIKIDQLKMAAEKNSPAMLRLDEMEQKFKELLNDNILELRDLNESLTNFYD
jgi:hypothetical protein